MISLEHKEYLKKVRKKKLLISFFRIFILILFLVLWEVFANFKVIDPFLTSSPSRIITTLATFIKDGSILGHISITLYETILGFTLGTLFGTAISIFLWWFPTISKILDPYIVVLNALPKVALAPIIIFWVGNGITAIIVIALLISVVTTTLSVYSGFLEVDKEKLLLMKTFKSSKIQTLRYLIIPSSLPNIISALKINVGLSWVGVIMGEFLVARSGIGFLLVYGGQISQLDMVMMGIVILSIIAFIMYKIVSIIESKFVNK